MGETDGAWFGTDDLLAGLQMVCMGHEGVN